jgi:hypothetical protein
MDKQVVGGEGKIRANGEKVHRAGILKKGSHLKIGKADKAERVPHHRLVIKVNSIHINHGKITIELEHIIQRANQALHEVLH